MFDFFEPGLVALWGLVVRLWRWLTRRERTIQLGSWWLFQDMSTWHVAEVVSIRRGRVHIASVFSHPFRHWWLNAWLFRSYIEYVRYLGQASDFSWLHPGAWVFCDVGEGNAGTWRVLSVDGPLVVMCPRRRPGSAKEIQSLVVPILLLRGSFRAASPHEARRGETEYGANLEASLLRALKSVPPEEVPKMDTCQDAKVVERSRYDVLMDED